MHEIDEKRVEKVWGSMVRLERAKYYVDNTEPSYHILSFGGGRQTVALLISMKKLFTNNKKAWVVFADTGGNIRKLMIISVITSCLIAK